MAELLGVSPAQVTRWRRGQGIDEVNAERVDLLDLVMANLLRLYPMAAAQRWLLGVNPGLHGHPLAGPYPPRADARGARCAGKRASRQLRVRLWRVLPWDPSAPAEAPGGALWVPRAFQGTGRHDAPDRYGRLYLAEDATSAVAEALAPFRGTGDLQPELLIRSGRQLALAELALASDAQLIDLDDPGVLDAEALRPSIVATGRRSVTQT